MNYYSHDMQQQKLDELKQIFPDAFSDGVLDPEKLLDILGSNPATEKGKERYAFTWNGKRACYRTIQTPSDATLKADEGNSVNFHTSENAIIEGDNLEVLKLLQKSYRGKVKMIYIDPPYNKQKDFIYSDNWTDPVTNYLFQTEQMDNEGYLLSQLVWRRPPVSVRLSR